MTRKDKIIYGLLGFGIFFIIFAFVTLMYFNFKLINRENKNKTDIVMHKDLVIICMKEQLECYQETKFLDKNKTLKICKDIDFCEKK